MFHSKETMETFSPSEGIFVPLPVFIERQMNISGKNPFIIPEILDQFFEFLPFSDLKNCRLVCGQWNELARPMVLKRSNVKFNTKRMQKSVNKFKEAVRNCDIDPTVFTCVQIGSPNDNGVMRKWKIKKCEKFFQRWLDRLKELKFYGCRIQIRMGNSRYNVGNLDLGPMLPKCLTRLKVDNLTNLHTRVNFPIESIQFVRFLHLEGCVLILQPGIILQAQEIILRSVKIRKEELFLGQLDMINQYINFDNLKNLVLNSSRIILDMQGSLCLESLVVHEVDTINWNFCQWKIQKRLKLHLTQREHLFKMPPNELTCKKLEVTLSSLNLWSLPKQIERLNIKMFNWEEKLGENDEDYVNLPNLKYLRIQFYTNKKPLSDYLCVFKQCGNLTHIDLIGVLWAESINYLKTSSIPSTVKKMRMHKDIKIENDEHFELDTLVLINYTPTLVSSLAEKLHVQNLVWDLYADFDEYRDAEVLASDIKNRQFDAEIMEKELTKMVNMNLETFSVGPFYEFKESESAKDLVFPLGDRQGKYYSYTGDKVANITQFDFKNLAAL